MRFPYTEVGPGISRAMIPVLIWGTAGSMPLEGLLDTGADRTLLPPQVILHLGLDVGSLPVTGAVRSSTGQVVPHKTTHLIFDLRRDSERYCWLAEVAVTTEEIRVPHWGFKGFLEHFRADFDGPNRCVTLTAGSSLPVIEPSP